MHIYIYSPNSSICRSAYGNPHLRAFSGASVIATLLDGFETFFLLLFWLRIQYFSIPLSSPRGPWNSTFLFLFSIRKDHRNHPVSTAPIHREGNWDLIRLNDFLEITSIFSGRICALGQKHQSPFFKVNPPSLLLSSRKIITPLRRLGGKSEG